MTKTAPKGVSRRTEKQKAREAAEEQQALEDSRAQQKRFNELLEQVENIVESWRIKPTTEQIETIAELWHYSRVKFVNELRLPEYMEQWSVEDRQHYATTLGCDLDFQWDDDAFSKFFKKASNKSTTVGKIGYKVSYPDPVTTAMGWEYIYYVQSRWDGIVVDDTTERQTIVRKEISFKDDTPARRAFITRYLNSLIDRFAKAELGASVVIRQGVYSAKKNTVVNRIIVSNTQQNREEIARLKSFIDEYHRREDLANIFLLDSVTGDTSHLRLQD